MKPQNLVPIDQVPKEILKKVCEKDDQFMWKVRLFVSENECQQVWEMFEPHLQGLTTEVEFGAYCNIRFSFDDEDDVRKDQIFLEGIRDFINENGVLDEHICPIIDDGIETCERYFDLMDDGAHGSELENLVDNIRLVVKMVETEIRKLLRSVSRMLENDEYVLKHGLEDFAENYSHRLFFEIEEGKVYSITPIKPDRE